LVYDTIKPSYNKKIPVMILILANYIILVVMIPIIKRLYDGFMMGLYNILYIILVGGAITILKTMTSSVGKDDIPYMKWNIIQSCLKHFETTNQLLKW